MTEDERRHIERARTLMYRINSMGDDEQSARRFGYARACALSAAGVLSTLLAEGTE